MYDTYKLMYQAKCTEYLNLDYNTLVEMFNNASNERVRNKVFASIFCKLFPLLFKVQKKFPTLTNEQKAEESLFMLYRSIKKFDPKKSKVKFSNYIYSNYQNTLINFRVMHDKRNERLWNNLYEANGITTQERKLLYCENTTSSSEFLSYLNNISHNNLLNTEEQIYCECILSGLTKANEILSELKLTTNPITKKVKGVYTPMVCSENKSKYYVRQIRKNLQDKFNKYESFLF